MELPLELKGKIDSFFEGMSSDELKKISKNITSKYKNESGAGKRLVSGKTEAMVYSAVRMPATYSAVCDALNLTGFSGNIDKVYDIGAGSGSASWASFNVFGATDITCFEREEMMRKIGSSLMANTTLGNVAWNDFDLTKDKLNGTSDLVISSYVLNELDPSYLESVLEMMWNSTDKLLTIIEPGTKEGFKVIMKVREYLLSKDAFLVAPCPHDGKCRLSSDDWCHFSTRVQRSKIHKLIKEADVPFEDEKYSFISFSKTPCERSEMRILRHPVIGKGRIDLTVCGKDENKDITLRKKDGENYKRAKKASWGDGFTIE